LWLALDDRSKVVVAYRLGKRTAENAKDLLADLRGRLRNRPQITTDGYAPYIDAVEEAFGSEVDYASIIKEAGFLKRVHQGNPDLETVSTSLIERCNLTVRMQNGLSPPVSSPSPFFSSRGRPSLGWRAFAIPFNPWCVSL